MQMNDSEFEDETHDIVHYVLSPVTRANPTLASPEAGSEDGLRATPFDAIMQQAASRKRGRLAPGIGSEILESPYPLDRGAAASSATTPDDEASQRQTAKLLAAVALLQEALQRQQQAREQELSSVNSALDKNCRPASHAAVSSLLAPVPTAHASAMLDVLAEARCQLIEHSRAVVSNLEEGAASPGKCDQQQLDLHTPIGGVIGDRAGVSAGSKKRPRSFSFGSNVHPCPAPVSDPSVPAPVPPHAVPAPSAWGDDDDALLAEFYDVLEAAALSQVVGAGSSACQSSIIRMPEPAEADPKGVEAALHAHSIELRCPAFIGAGPDPPPRGSGQGGSAAAASRVISILRQRLSPAPKVASSDGPVGDSKQCIGLMRGLQLPTASAGEVRPPSPPAFDVRSAPVQFATGAPPPLEQGGAVNPVKAAAPTHPAAAEDDAFLDAADLECLEALEQALCPRPAAPSVPREHALPHSTPPVAVRGVEWRAISEIPHEEVRRLLGEFGRPQEREKTETPFDPARLLLPAHLRCVVLAVSRIHTAVAGFAPQQAARSSAAAAASFGVQVRQRLWRVAFVRTQVDLAVGGSRPQAADVVSEALVAVRGQWVECSRVAPGTVVHVIAVWAGRAVTSAEAERTAAAQRWEHGRGLGDPRFLALGGDPARWADVCRERDRLGLAPAAAAGPPLVIVDDASNAIVVHPDLLLAPTRIAGVQLCLRRAVLNETMGDAGGADTFSHAAELGTLKHALFEAALRVTAAAGPPPLPAPAAPKEEEEEGATKPNRAGLSPLAVSWSGDAAPVLRRHLSAVAHSLTYSPAMLLKLVSSGSTDTETLTHLLGTIPGIVDWMGRYAARQPDAPALAVPSPLVLRRLVGAEDEIWSPLFGLRGIVDSTVDVDVVRPAFLRLAGPMDPQRLTARSHSGQQLLLAHRGCADDDTPVAAVATASASATTVSRRLPLELKTGRRPREGSTIEHRAQVALYDLLMAERYGRGDRGGGGGTDAPPPLLPHRPGRLPAAVVVPPDLTLGAYQADGHIDAVGGLLVYMSGPEEQQQAAAAAAAAASTGGRGGPKGGPAASGAGAAAHYHYTSLVPALWPEQRGLIIMRNRLAVAVLEVKTLSAGLHGGGGEGEALRFDATAASAAHACTQQPAPAKVSPLPPLLQEAHKCSKCYMFAACATAYVTQELPLAEARAAALPAAPEQAAAGDDEDEGTPLLTSLLGSVKPLYLEALGHVSPPLRAYVGRWLRLVDLEASAGLLVSAAAAAAAEGPAEAHPPAAAAAPGPAAVDMEDLVAPGPAATRQQRGKASAVRLRAGADYRSRLWMERAADCERGQGTTAAGMVLVGQSLAVRRPKPAAQPPQAPDLPEEKGSVGLGLGVPAAGADADDEVAAAGAPEAEFATQYLYTFVTAEAFARGVRGLDDEPSGAASEGAPERSLQSGLDIDVGDLVTASGDGSTGPFGLIRGPVDSKRAYAIVVRGDRDVSTAFGWTIAGACEPARGAASPRTQRPWLWRIDRDEMTTSARVIKDNLVRFLLGPTLSWGAEDEGSPEEEDGAPQPQGAAPAAVDEDDDVFAGFDFATLDAAAAAAAQGETGAAQALLAQLAPAAKDPTPSPPARLTVTLPPGVGRGDVKRQRLLVGLDQPRFLTRRFLPWTLTPAAGARPLASALASDGGGQVQACGSAVDAALRAGLVRAFETGLNSDQQAAVDGCLRARDYACILGMPGSGKTSTVAFIVRCIVASGRSVLITSHTHSAVDTLLLKVTQGEGAITDVMRLGRPSQVHPALRRYCIEEDIASGAVSAVGQLRYRMASTPVVGATCLAVRHALFTSGRTFDYCIVDEASQIPEPIALGPLRFARTFLLVGDHNQLPPLVVSRQARAEGMDESLFKRLADAHPLSVYPLTQQYRMNADIQLIPNDLCYAGALKCATPVVAGGRYYLADARGALQTIRAAASRAQIGHQSGCAISDGPTDAVDPLAWLSRCLADDTTVLFLDTDAALPPLAEPTAAGRPHPVAAAQQTPCLESRPRRARSTDNANDGAAGSGGGSGIYNDTEAAIVALLCHAISLAGGLQDDVGVIAPYRAQLRLIRSLLLPSSKLSSGATAVEVETVDRYQGRDKPVIILSCVRSNAHSEVGALLADVRRLNVALTRAKFRLIVIGSAKTLAGGCPTYARMIGLMEQRGWVHPLTAASGRTAAAALLGCALPAVHETTLAEERLQTTVFTGLGMEPPSIPIAESLFKYDGEATRSGVVRTGFSTAGSGRPIAISAAALLASRTLLNEETDSPAAVPHAAQVPECDSGARDFNLLPVGRAFEQLHSPLVPLQVTVATNTGGTPACGRSSVRQYPPAAGDTYANVGNTPGVALQRVITPSHAVRSGGQASVPSGKKRLGTTHSRPIPGPLSRQC